MFSYQFQVYFREKDEICGQFEAEKRNLDENLVDIKKTVTFPRVLYEKVDLDDITKIICILFRYLKMLAIKTPMELQLSLCTLMIVK